MLVHVVRLTYVPQHGLSVGDLSEYVTVALLDLVSGAEYLAKAGHVAVDFALVDEYVVAYVADAVDVRLFAFDQRLDVLIARVSNSNELLNQKC